MKNIFITLLFIVSLTAKAQYAAIGASQAGSKFPAATAYGITYSENFTTLGSLANYTKVNPTGTVTMTLTGGFLQFTNSPGTGGFNDYIYLNSLFSNASTQGTNMEFYRLRCEFYVRNLSGTTYGLSVGLKSISGNNPTNVTGLISLYTAHVGETAFYSANVTRATVAHSGGISVNDKIQLTLWRQSNVYSVVSRNLTTSTVLDSTIYTFPTSSTNPPAQNLGVPVLFSHGGTQDLTSLELTTTVLLKNVQTVFVGNSITQWYSVTAIGDRYWRLAITGSSKSNLLLAGQGQRTSDFLNNLSEIKALNPKIVFLMIGTNDIGTGVSSGTWQANFTSFVDQLLSANIFPVILYEPPRNTFDMNPATVGSLNNWISTTYGSSSRVIVIDTYTPLKAGGGNGLNATYDAGDGIHINTAGNLILSNTIRAAVPYLLYIP
jgi:lysophospholipase L1-like esterase